MPNALQGLLAPTTGEIKATPRNKLMGLLADFLAGGTRPDPAMPGGVANPALGLLNYVLPVESAAKVANNISYGYPITNKGKANVPFLPAETADVAMMAPISPRNALAALGMVGGMADNGAMRAATVWHGSPHKFDRFDASKIGTGEGAQAYGHGLYFAESPDVAKNYREALAKTPVTSYVADGKEIVPGNDSWHAADVAARMRQYGIDPKTRDGKDWLESEIGARYMGGAEISTADVMKHYKRGVEQKKELGALYKVDLPDDAIAKMLDWDKPLSQQAPEVSKALQSVVGDVTSGGFDLSRAPRNVRNAFDASAIKAAEAELTAKYGARKTADGWIDKSGRPIQQASVDAMLAKLGGRGYDSAGQLYNDLAHIAGSQADISAVLRNNGIPGVRYLDGGSRGTGGGTSNFVVFPGQESLLTILERNGQPLR